MQQHAHPNEAPEPLGDFLTEDEIERIILAPTQNVYLRNGAQDAVCWRWRADKRQLKVLLASRRRLDRAQMGHFQGEPFSPAAEMEELAKAERFQRRRIMHELHDWVDAQIDDEPWPGPDGFASRLKGWAGMARAIKADYELRADEADGRVLRKLFLDHADSHARADLVRLPQILGFALSAAERAQAHAEAIGRKNAEWKRDSFGAGDHSNPQDEQDKGVALLRCLARLYEASFVYADQTDALGQPSLIAAKPDASGQQKRQPGPFIAFARTACIVLGEATERRYRNAFRNSGIETTLFVGDWYHDFAKWRKRVERALENYHHVECVWYGAGEKATS